jgi:Fur family transcriptional regulator, zinc uptake regulator
MAHPHHHDHRHEQPSIAPADPQETVLAAAATCKRLGLKLTDQRRDVMLALAEAQKPLGAYDLLSILTLKGYRKLAPVSIYRALEFLIEAGLVHRLESQNAFIPCPHQHASEDAVVFLICRTCGKVEEAMSEPVRQSLQDIAQGQGFGLEGQVIELKGRCASCAHLAAAA